MSKLHLNKKIIRIKTIEEFYLNLKKKKRMGGKLSWGLGKASEQHV